MRYLFLAAFLLFVSCKSGDELSSSTKVQEVQEVHLEKEDKSKAAYLTVLSFDFKNFAETNGFQKALAKFAPSLIEREDLKKVNFGLWNVFFIGSVAQPILSSRDQPIILYIHPYTDSVMLTEWNLDSSEPEMVDIAFTSSLSLMENRNLRKGELPRHLSSFSKEEEYPYPIIIGRNTSQLISFLDKEYAPISQKKFDVSLIGYEKGSSHFSHEYIEILLEDSLKNVLWAINLDDQKGIASVIHKLGLALKEPKALRELTNDKFVLSSKDWEKFPAEIRANPVLCHAIIFDDFIIIYFNFKKAPTIFVAATISFKDKNNPEIGQIHLATIQPPS